MTASLHSLQPGADVNSARITARSGSQRILLAASPPWTVQHSYELALCKEAILTSVPGGRALGFRQVTNLVCLSAHSEVSNARTCSGWPRRWGGDPFPHCQLQRPFPLGSGGCRVQCSGWLPLFIHRELLSLLDRGWRRTDPLLPLSPPCPQSTHLLPSFCPPNPGGLVVLLSFSGPLASLTSLQMEFTVWWLRGDLQSLESLERWSRVPAILLFRRMEQGGTTAAVTSFLLAYCGSLGDVLLLDPDRGYLDLCPDPLRLLLDPQS